MKIGILTFHCAHNYGAVLQCYALQEILKSSGHDVEIIDYRPNYLINPYKVFYIRRFISHSPIKIIKAWINEFLIIKHRMKRYQAFQSLILLYQTICLHLYHHNKKLELYQNFCFFLQDFS